jgi:NAD(P)-dependent dehydrogenase (short-subunit alcohol dehydrogenase family)
MVKAIRALKTRENRGQRACQALGQPEEIASIIAWIASDEGGHGR